MGNVQVPPAGVQDLDEPAKRSKRFNRDFIVVRLSSTVDTPMVDSTDRKRY